MRVLLDSSVVRSGFVSRTGASRLLLTAVLSGRVTAVASTALLLEYQDVLLRPGTLAAAGLSAGIASDFLDDIVHACTPVAIRVSWRPATPDPGDELVLDAAVNGRADVIATFDLRHLRAAAARFNVVAERPGDVLRRLL